MPDYHLKRTADGHLMRNGAGHLVHTCASGMPAGSTSAKYIYTSIYDDQASVSHDVIWKRWGWATDGLGQTYAQFWYDYDMCPTNARQYCDIGLNNFAIIYACSTNGIRWYGNDDTTATLDASDICWQNQCHVPYQNSMNELDIGVYSPTITELASPETACEITFTHEFTIVFDQVYPNSPACRRTALNSICGGVLSSTHTQTFWVMYDPY